MLKTIPKIQENIKLIVKLSKFTPLTNIFSFNKNANKNIINIILIIILFYSIPSI